MLLFGAGASRPFGIPTMQEMVDDFERELSQSTIHFTFYQDIKKSLVEQYGPNKTDIESILSVLQGIGENVTPSDLGHFTYYYISKNCSKKSFSEEDITKAKEITIKLKDYIKTKCQVNSKDLTSIYSKTYLPLFQNLAGTKFLYHGNFELATEWKSFTTNYDDIFERFWSKFQEPNSHFERQGTSNNYIFNSNITLDNQSLSKLHGSLDWTRIKDTDQIFRSAQTGFNTHETEGDVMLYPIQQKDLYLHPWFTLFQDFKKSLEKFNQWYIIGYAFNDEFILNVIKEGLTKKSKTMIVINPNAEVIRNKFPDVLRKQIIALPYKFGDQYFVNNFIEFQRKVRNIELSIQTNAQCFKIEFPFKVHTEYVHKIEHGSCANATVLPNNHQVFEYNTEKGSEISITLNADFDFDYTRIENLDFTFISNSKTPVKCTIKNQKRIIDTCTLNDWTRLKTDENFLIRVRSVSSRNFLI